jgi:purine-binding chemotaxis protein CheW
MNGPEQIVVFTLDRQLYGVPLATVERVVRMVEITPIPGVEQFIRGVINVQGNVIPVIGLRQLFGLPDRPPELSDQILITRFGGRRYALVADAVSEVRECEIREVTDAVDILPGMPFLVGVAKLPDGMILIHDPHKLLSPPVRELLDLAVMGERV